MSGTELFNPGGGDTLPVLDSKSVVKDVADPTKQMRIDVGTVTTGNIRVLTMPDSDVDLGAIASFPVIDTTSIVKGSVDPTKAIRFEVDGLTTATVRTLTVPDKDFTIGDVSGPGSSTDNTIPRFHLSSGGIIQGSGIVVDDSDNITGAGTINGVDIESHASRHATGGGDAITAADIDAEPEFSKNTAFNKDFGSGSGTVCEGDDSRLSDARTPTSHNTSHQSGGGDAIQLDNLAAPDDNTDLDFSTSLHGLVPKGTNVGDFLKDDGSWGTPAGAGDVVGPGSSTDHAVARFNLATGKLLQNSVMIVTDAGAVTGVASINGVVVETHAARHKSGGSDTIKLDELAAPTDVTTLNASSSAHGLLPKLSNNVAQFLNGQGGFTVPVGSGDVTGPGSSTDNAVALFNSTSGKIIKNSTLIFNSGAVTGVTSLVASGVITALTFKGGFNVQNVSSTGTESAAAIDGGVIQTTTAITRTLPAVVIGKFITYITADANIISIKANGSDRIILDGVALDDGDKITSSGVINESITLYGESADGWRTYGKNGTWVDGGA